MMKDIDKITVQLQLEEDWDENEYTDLLKSYKDKEYSPAINGSPDENYLKEHSVLQKQTALSGEVKKIKLPSKLTESRVERILELDKKCAEECRLKMSCLEDGIIEDSITKFGDELITLKSMGEEIVSYINCVGFLNAPQCYSDLQGDGRLFLTRRPIPTAEGEYHYRLFFYSRHESGNFDSREFFHSVKSWMFQVLCDIEWCCGKKKKSTYTFDVEDLNHRSVDGAFISLNLEDLLSAHHQVHDSVDMHKFSTNHDEKEEDLACGLCCSIKCNCCSCNICPSCSFLCGSHEERLLKWNLTAKSMQVGEIDKLVSQSSYSASRDEEAVILDPFSEKERAVSKSVIEEKFIKRFHTIHLVYTDDTDYTMKHKGVIVVSPDEDSRKCIDLICQLSGAIEDRKVRDRLERQNFLRNLKLEAYDPLSKYQHLLHSREPDLSTFLLDAISGGVHIRVDMSYHYRVTYYTIFLFSFICMIVSFSFTANHPILVLNGLYSMFAFIEKLRYMRVKEFDTKTLQRDVIFSVLGFIFFIATSASSPATGGVVVSCMFTFLQFSLRILGLWMQYHSYAKGEGITGAKQLTNEIVVSDLA